MSRVLHRRTKKKTAPVINIPLPTGSVVQSIHADGLGWGIDSNNPEIIIGFMALSDMGLHIGMSIKEAEEEIKSLQNAVDEAKDNLENA